MEIDLFESWFRIADENRDNVISGAEAVKFFQRSNLSQETLFKVGTWQASGENLSLLHRALQRLHLGAPFNRKSPSAGKHELTYTVSFLSRSGIWLPEISHR